MKSSHSSGTLLLCVLVSLCLALSSCAAPKAPKDVLDALVKAEKGKVSGSIYMLSADEGTREYISDTALISLYGFDRTLDGLSGGAVYLSDFCHPVEFAVFLCRDTYTAEDVAMYLKNRVRTLYENASASAPFCDLSEDEYRAYIKNADVAVSGKYVALIISSDTREAKRAFYRAV